ncbi:hypothetical protein F4809DRAFT_534434 [Biscogniauxia mediterranea]|nr:hypothetical protein F4809DRAFT_534434 [Biscogniauxia mediterranea]
MALAWINTLPPYAQEIVLDGPAMLPPQGVIPELDNPPNRNYIGYVTNAICIAALSAVLLIRGYAKLVCIRKVEIEDYLALAALGTWAGFVYGNYWLIDAHGVFVHQWNIRIRDMTEIMRMVHICSNLAAGTICLIKAAILIEWDRIFVPRGVRNYFFWTSRVILAIHVLFHLSWIMAENLGCTPYQKIWDETIAEGTCIDQKLLYTPAAIVNLITNFVVLLLPQKVIWDLQLSPRNKIGVSVVFAVGILYVHLNTYLRGDPPLFLPLLCCYRLANAPSPPSFPSACIGASFRLVESVRFYQSDDLVYAVAWMNHWILVEMTCQFVVFCAPTTPIVFRGLGATAKAGSNNKSWANLSSKPSSDSDSGGNRVVSVPRVARVVGRAFGARRKPPRQRDGRNNNNSDESLWSLPFVANVPGTGTGPTTEITVQPPVARVRTTEGILCTTRIVHREEYVDSPTWGIATSSRVNTPTC